MVSKIKEIYETKSETKLECEVRNWGTSESDCYSEEKNWISISVNLENQND